MQYVVYRRFRARCLSGDVNLPYGTRCETQGEIICHNGRPLVVVTSENAHQFFARNDDGKGLERGKLIRDIMARLTKNGTKYFDTDKSPFGGGKIYPEKLAAYNVRAKERQAAWVRIWGDPKLDIYRMREHADHWLWNHAFFNAEISELQYILATVKGGTSCTE